LPASLDNLPIFEFGSNNKVAPRTFEFDTWSKVSLLARAPQLSSTVWSRSTSDQEKAQIKDESEKTGRTTNNIDVSVRSIENPEELMGGSAFEKPTASSKDDLATDTEETQSVSEPTKTPLKMNARKFEGLLTPEGTPESSQSETAIPVLVEGSTTVSGTHEPPRAAIDGDFHSLDGAPATSEVTLEPLRTEDKKAPEAIGGNISKPPKTPTKTCNQYAEGLKTPEVTPEPSQIPESPIHTIPEEHTSPVENTLATPVQTENEEKEDDLMFKATPEPSQTCEKDDYLVFKGGIVATKLSSELALMNEDIVSTTEGDNATPGTIPELSKSDQDGIPIIEGDTASYEVESGLPKPDQKAPSAEEESDAGPKTEHERYQPNEEAFPVIQEDTELSQITLEPIDDSLPKRAESLGHALIDPSERRYTTRFSERQRQALLTAPQIQEAPHSFNDEDTFSEVQVHIEPFTTASASKLAAEVINSTSRREPSPALDKGEYVLNGEYLGWENDRGLPKKGRRRRVWENVRDGYTAMSEAVQRKARRSSKIPRE